MQGLLRCITMNISVGNFSCSVVLLLLWTAIHSSRLFIAKLFPFSVHLQKRLSLKLSCKEIPYVCGPDGPNEAKTTSCFVWITGHCAVEQSCDQSRARSLPLGHWCAREAVGQCSV
ncbi:hypothetical protein AMECASPLE_038511 [Ameca splendens]|uniref:Secreted protein n=1 Tax=Ameca splendens TaxID=208324 RepID=A0ABV1A3M2_9TELE